LASREGAAEGGPVQALKGLQARRGVGVILTGDLPWGENSAALERSAGAKRRRVSSLQKMFEQSCIIPQSI